jgi:uncharacterized protein (TIGR04255 family)
MHPKLSKAPVTYVLAQIKFSSIEDIANRIPALQDKIRGDFPHYQQVNIQSIQLREGQQPAATTLIQWHFLDKEKQTGIILDKQTLTIQTSCYEQFQPLLNRFKAVASQFHEILKFSLFTRLGLRYINLIEDGLTKLDPGLQGFQLANNDFDKNQFLTKTETTQRSQAGVLKVQATRFSDKKVIGDIQNIFVPLELADTAKLLSFNGREEPGRAFLLLDLDHFHVGQGDFDIEVIGSRFCELQKMLYQGFCQAVGKENLTAWS